MDAKAILITGAAVGIPALLASSKLDGAHPGKANTAAMAALERGDMFDVPTSGSAVDAFKAMQSQLGTTRDIAESSLVRLCQAWLAAYDAGAAADAVNYTLVGTQTATEDPLPFDFSTTDRSEFCDKGASFVNGMGTPLGVAVCELATFANKDLGWLGDASFDQQRRAFDAIGKLARAMDAADYVAAGQRRSDNRFFTPLSDLAHQWGRRAAGLVADVLGGVVGGFVMSPLGLVVIGGGAYLYWRHAR